MPVGEGSGEPLFRQGAIVIPIVLLLFLLAVVMGGAIFWWGARHAGLDAAFIGAVSAFLVTLVIAIVGRIGPALRSDQHDDRRR